jgi:hypothetical protein
VWNGHRLSALLMQQAVQIREMVLKTRVIGLIKKSQGQLPSQRKRGIPFPDIPP